MHDVIIIGAGIVGLATAWQLKQARPGLRVLVLDKEPEVAMHQTSHNSGVIHSGIYYKPGSLKAQNCRRGYQLLLQFCREYGVRHEICGKLIVATQQPERPALSEIFRRGLENGLEGIRLIGPAEAREIEPHVNCVEAILVPQTGIISYLEVAQAYRDQLLYQDGELALSHQVVGITKERDGWRVITGRSELLCRVVVNCAGLYADKIARMTQPEIDLLVAPFRGEYYELLPGRQHLVRNLIYPVPNPKFPFLGVHFTRMIHGGIEAGPNAVPAFRREGYHRSDFQLGEFLEALGYPGYRRMVTRYWREGLEELQRSFFKQAFVRSLQRLIPEVREEDFRQSGAGVRAQAIERSGLLCDDFLIHECPGVVNVCNAPSPAATSSLAVGETVAGKVLSQLATLGL
jgi:L-2-hydroxyglutarate oxidase